MIPRKIGMLATLACVVKWRWSRTFHTVASPWFLCTINFREVLVCKIQGKIYKFITHNQNGCIIIILCFTSVLQFLTNLNSYLRICATDAGPYQSPACLPACWPTVTRWCSDNGLSSSGRSLKNLKICWINFGIKNAQVRAAYNII